MSILNILTSITNFSAIFPILTAMSHSDFLTATLIIFGAVASMISHLFESHKHSMTGFGTHPRLSYLLNRVDILGVILVLIRLFYLFILNSAWFIIYNNPKFLFIASFVISTNFISELDKGYTFYVPIHCFWHISAFLVINEYLNLIY